MAAARNLPIPEAVQTITIDATFTPTPKGIIVHKGDTVNFVNNSSSTVTIQFAPNPPGPAVSGNVSIPANSTGGFVAPNVDAAANYDIYVGSVKQNTDPYAIQVGVGPLYLQVTWSQALGAGQCTPDPLSLPFGGSLEAFSTDSTSYTLTWPATGDPFTPPLTSVVPGVGNNIPGAATSTTAIYKFKVVKSGFVTESTGSGGGTVKVRGS